MSRIEIITIGDELVEGRLIETNAAELSAQLADHGFRVAQHLSVGDRREEVVRVLRDAAERAEVVLVSGGLGPTTDDLTAECAAEAFAAPLTRSEQAEAHVREFFRVRKRTMSPNNLKQADLPAGSELIPNPIGSAVGFLLEQHRCRLYFLPGVPRELRRMFTCEVLPDLQRRLTPAVQHIATLRTFGKTESEVGQLLDGLASELPSEAKLTIQYRAAFPEIHVRLVLAGVAAETASECLLGLVSQARQRIGPAVYAAGLGTVATEFAAVVLRELKEHGKTLAVADSCSQGRLAELLETDGTNPLFLGAWVIPRLHSFARLVHPVQVPQCELISEQVAILMAEQVREAFAASCGLAVVGSAEESSAGSPGTLWIAATDGDATTSRQLVLPFDPERFRLISAHVALAVLRRWLVKRDDS